MTEMQPPDSFHLRSAQGWFELGDHIEANEELEKISPKFRVHPDVLELRLEIYAKAKKWEACVDIATALLKLDPSRPTAWIHRAFALHELKHTAEAYEALLPAADRFTNIWTIPYNLACYCAQLGRLDECRKWFSKAIELDTRSVQLRAISDPDLSPLWDGLTYSH